MMNSIQTCKVFCTPTLCWESPGIKTFSLETILAEAVVAFICCLGQML
jgi:hypothetical protein